MMLSISNIAWDTSCDASMHDMLRKEGFMGLEIAPTRIFPERPYDDTARAAEWKDRISAEFGLEISSMQSIWYGRSEKLFGSVSDREQLTEYTKKAIDFAEAIACRNLVFGCPKNRSVPEGGNADLAVPFFKALGDYAFEHNTVLAMEANPPIYGTNYVNTTTEAFALIEKVGSKGFKLNLDLGTMIENEESIDILEGRFDLINHIHVSEPGLKPIQEREIHRQLAEMIRGHGYGRYVSIEMGKQEDVETVRKTMEYVKKVFGAWDKVSG